MISFQQSIDPAFGREWQTYLSTLDNWEKQDCDRVRKVMPEAIPQYTLFSVFVLRRSGNELYGGQILKKLVRGERSSPVDVI